MDNILHAEYALVKPHKYLFLLYQEKSWKTKHHVLRNLQVGSHDY